MSLLQQTLIAVASNSKHEIALAASAGIWETYQHLQDFSSYLRSLVVASNLLQKDLAAAIGIGPSRLSHALKGAGGYTFNVENCLRLAKIANRPATEVLRAAGKDDVADLLEFLFPKAGQPAVTGEDHRLLTRIKKLDENDRVLLEQMVTNMERHRPKEQRSRVADRKHA